MAYKQKGFPMQATASVLKQKRKLTKEMKSDARNLKKDLIQESKDLKKGNIKVLKHVKKSMDYKGAKSDIKAERKNTGRQKKKYVGLIEKLKNFTKKVLAQVFSIILYI